MDVIPLVCPKNHDDKYVILGKGRTSLVCNRMKNQPDVPDGLLHRTMCLEKGQVLSNTWHLAGDWTHKCYHQQSQIVVNIFGGVSREKSDKMFFIEKKTFSK